jgi:hypothetical protein
MINITQARWYEFRGCIVTIPAAAASTVEARKMKIAVTVVSDISNSVIGPAQEKAYTNEAKSPLVCLVEVYPLVQPGYGK